jgi:hypothetical protein
VVRGIVAVRRERRLGRQDLRQHGVLWLLASVAPPAVMLLVWRAPTQTVAELLYDANHPNKDGRP